MKNKSCKDSEVTMTQLVMPNDTNPHNNLMGGNLLRWMDIASSISASKLSGGQVVTAAVDNVSFEQSIKQGDVVTIHAKVSRVFNTSMEVHLEVYTQSFGDETMHKSNEAFYTFVALDNGGRPKKAPQVKPETDKEKRLFESAQRRREMRLILAGRLDPEKAKELQSIFLPDLLKEKSKVSSGE